MCSKGTMALMIELSTTWRPTKKTKKWEIVTNELILRNFVKGVFYKIGFWLKLWNIVFLIDNNNNNF